MSVFSTNALFARIHLLQIAEFKIQDTEDRIQGSGFILREV